MKANLAARVTTGRVSLGGTVEVELNFKAWRNVEAERGRPCFQQEVDKMLRAYTGPFCEEQHHAAQL